MQRPFKTNIENFIRERSEQNNIAKYAPKSIWCKQPLKTEFQAFKSN